MPSSLTLITSQGASAVHDVLKKSGYLIRDRPIQDTDKTVREIRLSALGSVFF